MIKLRTKLVVAVAAAVALTTTAANATLILEIDQSAKTFRLTGEDDIGFVDAGGVGNIATYFLFPLGGGGGSPGSVKADGMWTSSVGTPAPFYGITESFFLQADSQLGGELSLYFGNSVSGLSTVTGTGVSVSYASLSPANQLVLESAIGSSVTKNSHNVGAPIAVVAASAVPDSGTTALMLGLGLLGMAGVKRKLRRA